jgi:GTP-binding protein LepA
VLNKIDLPAAKPEKYAAELATSSAAPPTCSSVSAKTGESASRICSMRIVADPAPVGDPDGPPGDDLRLGL